jgi:hypothetical protein
MAYGDRTKCLACGGEIIQLGGDHRQRQYCDDTCRQAAFRKRREEQQRRQCEAKVQTWGNFQPETVSLLAGLLYGGSEDYARRLTRIIQREQGQDTGVLSQNLAEAREKLAACARHTQKLERQVQVQHERLGLYYQASFRVSELEREVARYREVLDLSQRAELQTELLALGAALSYRRLLIVPISIEPGQAAWCSYVDNEPNETLAKAILVARHFYDNLKALGMLS